MSREPHVPVTREGAVGTLKLMMIVLAAVIFWQAAAAVNVQFHEQGLVTAPSFLKSAAHLLVGTESSGAFPARLAEMWQKNHHLVALTTTLIVSVFLLTRYLILGRVLDYLYLESPVRDKRIYSGFIANIFFVLVHAAIIYGLVALGRDNHASLVPLIVLLFLLFNMFWSGGIFYTSRQVEKHALRGLKYMAITAGTTAIIFFCISWMAESNPTADEAMRSSTLTVLGTGMAFAVCLIDAIIQMRIYCSRIRPAPLKG